MDGLRPEHYLRYMDDFLLLGPSKAVLHGLRRRVRTFLRDRLDLELHPTKVRVFPARTGVDFLGFVVLPGTVRVRRSNVSRFVARSRGLAGRVAAGEVTAGDAARSTRSWVAHASHGDTRALRRSLLIRHPWLERLADRSWFGARGVASAASTPRRAS